MGVTKRLCSLLDKSKKCDFLKLYYLLEWRVPFQKVMPFVMVADVCHVGFALMHAVCQNVDRTQIQQNTDPITFRNADGDAFVKMDSYGHHSMALALRENGKKFAPARFITQ